MLKKFTVVSNNICFGPEPKIGSEVKQRFTLNEKGQVWFSGYTYGGEYGKYSVGRRARKKIPSAEAERLLYEVSAYFSDGVLEMITDVGDYDLILFFDDGKSEIVTGPLLCTDKMLKDLCDCIRVTVGMDDLFLFDRNEDCDDDDE